MNPHAQSAYASAAAPLRTGRGAEYAVFARVTAGLKAAVEQDARAFPALARAVHDNQRLWSALADDLMLETNALPPRLRADLLGLAAFVRRHSGAVLAGRAALAPLIDINTAIMKGLRGEMGAAA